MPTATRRGEKHEGMGKDRAMSTADAPVEFDLEDAFTTAPDVAGGTMGDASVDTYDVMLNDLIGLDGSLGLDGVGVGVGGLGGLDGLGGLGGLDELDELDELDGVGGREPWSVEGMQTRADNAAASSDLDLSPVAPTAAAGPTSAAARNEAREPSPFLRPGPRAPSPGPRAPSPGPRAPSPGPRAPSPGPRAPTMQPSRATRICKHSRTSW